MTIEYRRGVSPAALHDIQHGTVDLVFTDPPYSTGDNGKHQYGRRQKWGVPHGDQFIANDTDLAEVALLARECARLLKPEGLALVFGAPSKRSEVRDLFEQCAGLQVVETILWDKGAPGLSHKFRWCVEDIHVIARRGVDIWTNREPLVVPVRVPRVADPQHPNEKPVRLFEKLIRWALPNRGLIVDPFAGVAPCGVGAAFNRCDYIGVECDPRWWPIAESRLAVVRDWSPSASRDLFGNVA